MTEPTPKPTDALEILRMEAENRGEATRSAGGNVSDSMQLDLNAPGRVEEKKARDAIFWFMNHRERLEKGDWGTATFGEYVMSEYRTHVEAVTMEDWERLKKALAASEKVRREVAEDIETWRRQPYKSGYRYGIAKEVDDKVKEWAAKLLERIEAE